MVEDGDGALFVAIGSVGKRDILILHRITKILDGHSVRSLQDALVGIKNLKEACRRGVAFLQRIVGMH